MQPTRDVSAERIQTMLAFLAKHPDVDFDWLDRVADGVEASPIKPNTVQAIAAMTKAGLISRQEARVLVLTGKMPELGEVASDRCAGAGCIEAMSIREPLELPGFTAHVPLCGQCDVKWKKALANLNGSGRRRRWRR